MKRVLSQDEEVIFGNLIRELAEDTRALKMKCFIQHGRITTYDHCISVAREAFNLNRRLHMHTDEKRLVRAAFLHDYFLYDWHVKDRSHRFHGFTHPRRALENADKEFQLTETERNMIYCHMFPLTPIPPSTKEAWIVCAADKICALSETMMTLLCRLKVYKTL